MARTKPTKRKSCTTHRKKDGKFVNAKLEVSRLDRIRKAVAVLEENANPTEMAEIDASCFSTAVVPVVRGLAERINQQEDLINSTMVAYETGQIVAIVDQLPLAVVSKRAEGVIRCARQLALTGCQKLEYLKVETGRLCFFEDTRELDVFGNPIFNPAPIFKLYDREFQDRVSFLNKSLEIREGSAFKTVIIDMADVNELFFEVAGRYDINFHIHSLEKAIVKLEKSVVTYVEQKWMLFRDIESDRKNNDLSVENDAELDGHSGAMVPFEESDNPDTTLSDDSSDGAEGRQNIETVEDWAMEDLSREVKKMGLRSGKVVDLMSYESIPKSGQW